MSSRSPKPLPDRIADEDMPVLARAIARAQKAQLFRSQANEAAVDAAKYQAAAELELEELHAKYQVPAGALGIAEDGTIHRGA